MSFKINLGNHTEETLDRNEQVPIDWYKAVLSDVVPDHDKGFSNLVFKITEGPYTGMTAKETMFDPQYESDDKKAETKLNKIVTGGTRLGLITKEDIAKGDLDLDFVDAIDKPVVIRVEHRPGKNPDGSANGKVFAQVAWLGFYPHDHYDIPTEVRKRLDLGAARPRPKGSASTTGGRGGAGKPPAKPPAAPNANDGFGGI